MLDAGCSMLDARCWIRPAHPKEGPQITQIDADSSVCVDLRDLRFLRANPRRMGGAYIQHPASSIQYPASGWVTGIPNSEFRIPNSEFN
jgi:hypothetical protein